MKQRIFHTETAYIVEAAFPQGPILFMQDYLQGGYHHCLKLCPDFFNAKKYKNKGTVKYKAHLVDNYLNDYDLKKHKWSVEFNKYNFIYTYHNDWHLNNITCYIQDADSINNIYWDEFGQLCEIMIEDNNAYINYLTGKIDVLNSQNQ